MPPPRLAMRPIAAVVRPTHVSKKDQTAEERAGRLEF
jgi:hypothetical protein